MGNSIGLGVVRIHPSRPSWVTESVNNLHLLHKEDQFLTLSFKGI